jgi:hypothetical protein
MERDVQDARVSRRPWMAESDPDRIDSNRLMAILAPSECTPVFAISLPANKVKIQF